MDRFSTSKHTSSTADWVNVILGVWMAISPAVLGFSRDNAAMWTNVGAGVALVLLNFAALRGWGEEIIPGILVLLGIWIFMSPFVLRILRPAFLWNNIVLAFAVIAGATIADEFRSINSAGVDS
jgi:hypothetical protein